MTEEQKRRKREYMNRYRQEHPLSEEQRKRYNTLARMRYYNMTEEQKKRKRERERKYEILYRQTHRKEKREYFRRYREEHRDKIREINKRYREENRESRKTKGMYSVKRKRKVEVRLASFGITPLDHS